MATKLVPYLNFTGNTAEAMRYYQGVFGGDLQIATFASFGIEGMPPEGTMHAALVLDQFTLMASDAMEGSAPSSGTSRINLAFMSDDAALLTGWFDRLAADGVVGQVLAKQVWGDIYGQVTDKFGMEWMFNLSAPETSSHPD
jgi:PhnB protein